VKVLASADIHGDHKSLQWIVDMSNSLRPEVVVLAGDLLGSPREFKLVEEAQAADAERTSTTLEQIAVPVLYLMGNDDLVPLQPRSKNIISLHGRRISFAPFNFVGYQFSLPFMGGIYEKPEEEIEKDIAAIEHHVDQDTVLVTHSPAHGVLDRGILNRHSGSTSILELIQMKKPRAHIHGHIHRHFGRQGIHFNVAADMQERAVLIDLESMKHTVLEGKLLP
jgi:Icc-related predicted phosphoesterase